MTATLIIDVRRLGQIQKKMSHTGRKALLSSIATELVNSTKQRFYTETDPFGVKWPRSKAARNSGKTLTRSGRLRNSITSTANSRHARVGTNVQYAAPHQFGARARVLRPRKKKALFWAGARHPVKKVNLPALPKRAFFGISRQDRALIQSAVARHIGA